MALNIINEAERCLGCKKPRCVEGCPVRTPIPELIGLFKENRLMEAGDILFENNPMSLICSIVCNHEAQCTGHCVLNGKNQPVRFYEIEQYISDAFLDRLVPQVEKNKKGKVAVIGAGPAGLTAAIRLAKFGYIVTIFDSKDRIGGMLQYGIPEFRLPKPIIYRYRKKIEEIGIHFRPNTTVGGALRIDDLFRDGYKSVFIGTGTWRPKTLGLEGESLPNVHFGVAYLSNPDAYSLGENVAVIGMGNVAVDVARTAFRHGARHVTLYARSRRISASEDEVMHARLDGAEFVFGRSIQKITDEGPVFQVACFDEEGNITGHEEEPEQVRADATIIAVSQGPKDKLISTTNGLKGNDRGLLVTDECGRTTREGVFAAGDVVHGSMTVVHAVADAKTTVLAMMDYMENGTWK